MWPTNDVCSVLLFIVYLLCVVFSFAGSFLCSFIALAVSVLLLLTMVVFVSDGDGCQLLVCSAKRCGGASSAVLV